MAPEKNTITNASMQSTIKTKQVRADREQGDDEVTLEHPSHGMKPIKGTINRLDTLM